LITSPLVNPSEYSSFSKLDTVRVCVPTLTVKRERSPTERAADPAAGPAVGPAVGIVARVPDAGVAAVGFVAAAAG
jgi:hypothetical protein